MILTTLIVIVVSVTLYIFYKWSTKYATFFKEIGMPHFKPTFIIGQTGGLLFRKISFSTFIEELYKKHPTSRVTGYFDFRMPAVLLRDPEIAKQLTVKDFEYFENRKSGIAPDIDELFGNSLFSLKGQKWHDMRATLSPAFTGSKMRQMFVLIKDCAEQMTQHFIKKSKNNESMDFDMKDIFSRYTNDVIATSAFGIKIDSFDQKDNEFYRMGQLFIKTDVFLFIRMLLFVFTPKILKVLKIDLMNPKLKKFFRPMVIDNMNYREKEGIHRPDMINLLMQVRKGQNSIMDDEVEEHKEIESNADDGFATVEESNVGKKKVVRKWSDMEIVAQCFLFFLAGFETSSNMLTFLAYEMARDPEIQKKLYEELLKNHNENGQQLDYNCLQKLKYLDMVVCETLRLWPAVPSVDRECVKDYQYDDGEFQFTITKGMGINIPVQGYHLDSKYFPNPERFDPERFNDENRHNINLNAYLPFGIGPRNCIGSRFALMELKTIVYYLLLNFSFEINDKTQIPLQLKKTPFTGLLPEKGVNLTFKLRENK